MPRILAVEADPARRTLLRTLVREHVPARLSIVESVAAALTEIDSQVPDVILTPALMSPADSAVLLDRVRALEHAPYVEVLAIPALDMLSAPEETGRRGIGVGVGVFRRRPAAAIGRYDPAMVGGLIADAVARAREARLEYAAALAREAEYEDMARHRASSTSLILAPAIDPSIDDRRVALRRGLRDLPWLSGARLSWGGDVALVNISTTGVLVESGSKLVPGTATELHLRGPETNLIVPVRFVRSEIARIDGLGVKYHAAGTFGTAIDLSGPAPAPAVPSAPAPRPPAPRQALADLLASALADARTPAHVQFIRGVRDLVGARDIQICTTTAAAGRETLYFPIPGDDRVRSNLQVVFARGHDVTTEQFTILKAAAWMTAAALELSTAPALLAERVA